MKAEVITVSSFAFRPTYAGATLEYCDKWFRECFFWRPSVVDATQCAVIRKAKNLAPLTNAFGFTSKLYHAVVGAVTILLNRCRPATILRFVVTFPVRVAIKGVIWGWRLTNVLKEVCEVHPSLTDFNSRSSVTLVARASRVKASLLHHCPNRVLTGGLSASHAAVFPKGFSGSVNLEAAATLGATVFEVATPYNFGVSAIALAQPKNPLPTIGTMPADNMEPVESSPHEINEF